jgi:hypothetical protein
VTIEESIPGDTTVDHSWREPSDLRPGTHGVVVSTWTTDKEESALDAKVQVRLIPADRNVDAVFVIDTTSSMSWIFETARSKALEMVKALEASREDGKDVRAGLIEYRDRGDRFRGTRDHIRLSALTSDWESLRSDFVRMRASGGGDMPEDVQGALLQGLEKLDWRTDADTTRSTRTSPASRPSASAWPARASPSTPSAPAWASPGWSGWASRPRPRPTSRPSPAPPGGPTR